MMNPEIRPIHPKAFGLDGEVNRLQERVPR
jgi:hypothetical protein